MIKPKRIKEGDTVFAVAPAGPVIEENFRKGIAALEEYGFKVKHRDDFLSADDFLAGTDDRRTAELEEAFSDPETTAVFCARGGYGSMRLLEKLDLRLIAGSRKPLIGFSDITALQLALVAKENYPTFHGPLLTTLWREIAISRRHLVEILTGKTQSIRIFGPGAVTLSKGSAEGMLIGGNLSMISAMLGTDFMPPLEGAILFLEDINEEPYRIDRLLMHLRLAGVFKKISGLACGSLSSKPEETALILKSLKNALSGSSIPALFGMPWGHGQFNMTLCQGIRASMEADERSLTFLETCVE